MLILSNEVVICNSLDIARILGAPKMTYAIDANAYHSQTFHLYNIETTNLQKSLIKAHISSVINKKY